LAEFWKITLLSCLFFSAALYRVNIKANAWVWNTLAFAAHPRVWGRDTTERSKLSNLVSNTLQGLMFLITLSLTAILCKEMLPKPYPDLLKNAAGEWLKPFIEILIEVPAASARYVALVLLCSTLMRLLYKAFTFGNANSGVLTNPADWLQIEANGQAEPVRQAGLQVLRARKLVMLSTIFTVWVFTFWAVSNTAWGQSRFPHAVWSWIRPYL
jgi:hypothetical protein